MCYEPRFLTEPKVLKVFISQPMSGRPYEQVMAERERILEGVRKRHLWYQIEVIDNYNHDLPEDAHPILYLSEDIKLMLEADVIVFAKDAFDGARGCAVEWAVVNQYNLKYELEE